MANPFLVLGGIAVGVVTAAFGVLQVPGWVAQAQDASAINDLSMVSAAQAASASLNGSYVSELTPLQDGSLGIEFALPDDTLLHLSADADNWCGVTVSDSGRYFWASDEGLSTDGADTLNEAVEAACGPGVPPSGDSEEVGSPEPPATADPEPLPTTDVLAYTVRSDTDVTFVSSLNNPVGTFTWSDGVTQTASGTSPTRPLTAGTTYQVTFEGAYDNFLAPTTAEGRESNASIRSMDKWFTTEGSASGASAFAGMTNLTDVPSAVPAITDATSMFSNAEKINDPDIGSWDVSQATRMTQAFLRAYAFNQDLSGWQTSNVTAMNSMFSSATAFNQDISGWDTSKVTDMRSVFLAAQSFNQDLSLWDTSKVTDMSRMFSAADSFNGDLSGWNTVNVKNMSGMFSGNDAFNRALPWNTSSVTNMSFMFYNAAAFDGNISGWSTFRVTDMNMMFSGASSFNQNISSWWTPSVVDMRNMFHEASSFSQNLSAWNVGKVRYHQYFSSGSPLTSSQIPKWVY